MAAYDIHKHFKTLNAPRRARTDPFATGFEDELKDKKSSKKAASATNNNTTTTTAKTTTTTPAFPRPVDQNRRAASPFVRRPARDDSSDDDNFLSYRPKQKTERHLSPAPPDRSSRSRRGSTASSTSRRSSQSPRGERENSTTSIVPRHTVASPFAGTKYLQDSDSEGDEEAVGSIRSGSQDSGHASPNPAKHDEDDPLDSLSAFYVPAAAKKEIKRVDKPKNQVSGISWRAFSEGRAEQRNSEIESLRTKLQTRGKSISFSSHVVTDDGRQIPIGQACAGRKTSTGGSSKIRQRSPPRSQQDTAPSDDELADGVERYNPTEFKTNPFTGQPIKRSNSNPGANSTPNVPVDNADRRPSSASGSVPHIQIDHVPDE